MPVSQDIACMPPRQAYPALSDAEYDRLRDWWGWCPACGRVNGRTEDGPSMCCGVEAADLPFVREADQQ